MLSRRWRLESVDECRGRMLVTSPRLRPAKGPRHRGIAAGRPSHGEPRDSWQQHGVGDSVRHVKESANRPAHAMNKSDAAIGKRHAALSGRHHHAFAGSPMTGFAPRGLQMVTHEPDAGQRQGIRQRSGQAGHEGFDAVRQRIDSNRSCQRRWHAERQFKVHQRHRRQQVRIEHHHLHVSRSIRDHRHLGDLAAGAGGGRNDEKRQPRIGHLMPTHETDQRRRIRRKNCYDFGTVDRTAAAQSDHGLRGGRMKPSETGKDTVLARIGLHIGENINRKTSGSEVSHRAARGRLPP